MDVLGIDFGTSNTVAVLVSAGRAPRVLSLDGSSWLPSCVYVDDDGSLSVGRDAERKARLAPERFEANPKRRIDDGEILLGVRVVPVVDAIAAVLQRVADEARRQLNGRSPDQVHLTHPAQWGAARQNVLLAAARAAGLGPAVTLIPEPVAAAAHFASLPGKSLPPGSSLAVYDLGGGTFDCAVVGATAQGYTVLAESGLPDVGGVDFDQAVVDHLGRTVSAEDPARWQALSRPRTASDRRAARTLREDVRAAKETLSRYAQTDLTLPDPFEDTLLTRKEFDGLIRPVLARTTEVLAETVTRAGLEPGKLAGIYLVGGSSRIPLVATMISDRTGVVATTLDQPETSVAMGAALAPGNARPQTRTEYVGPLSGGSPAAGSQPPGGAPTFVAGATGALAPRTGGPGGYPGPGTPGGAPPGSAGVAGGGHRGGPPTGGSGYPDQGGGRQSGDRPGAGPGFGGPPTQARQFAGGPASGGPRPPNGPHGPGGPPSGGFPGDRKPGGRRRRLQVVLIAAIVAVIAVATTVIIVATSSSNSAGPGVSTPASAGSPPAQSSAAVPSKPPSGSTAPSGVPSAALDKCSADADGQGLTPCMRAAVGTLAAKTCTQDPTTLGITKDNINNFTVVSAAWIACVDTAGGYGAIIFQANNGTARDAIWDAVIKEFPTQQRAGSWHTADLSGDYAAGETADGETWLAWRTQKQPVVSFLVGTNTATSVDEAINYWQTALGAQI